MKVTIYVNGDRVSVRQTDDPARVIVLILRSVPGEHAIWERNGQIVPAYTLPESGETLEVTEFVHSGGSMVEVTVRVES